MFVSPDDFSVPGDLIETDAKRRRQKAFRKRVKVDLVVEASDAAFANPAALASAVTRALANWRAEREQVDRITAELVAAKEAAANHEARATELERALQEGQKEREALRAAVEALADRAREPDASPKIEQALALLPEGRTAEAEAVFAEIVTRKEAEGRRKQVEGAADLRRRPRRRGISGPWPFSTALRMRSRPNAYQRIAPRKSAKTSAALDYPVLSTRPFVD